MASPAPAPAPPCHPHRRKLLLTTIAAPLVFLHPLPTHARLFQMPPSRLSNRYFLVRSGESEYESLGVVNTNPVSKTSMDSGLSESGKRQAVKAAVALKDMGACGGSCWIWPSITQRSYQAAEIIAAVNGVSRSRIVPEYSFLDARGLGAYEGRSLNSIDESDEKEIAKKRTSIDPFSIISQIRAMDIVSQNIKPPKIDDGTPNESVADVFVRVTQLMSVTETQYSDDTVVIVSPDSDNLSILQAGLLGLDLRRHGELYFDPGEVRLVDEKNIGTSISNRRPASAVFKCSNPPSCTE